MPVVNVWKVRVVMGQRLMRMRMGMGLGAVPIGTMQVLVMGIVAMRMRV